MAKNLIPEIAKLLGVETGEKFMIRQNKYIFEDSIFMIDKDNGLLKILDDGNFEEENTALYHVLSGKIEIVKLPWEPQEGDMYYILNTRALFIESFMWDNGTFDYLAKNMGIIYRTKAEAEAHLEEDYERLTGKPLGSC